jgi:anti-anti-sigma regulatory factor
VSISIATIRFCGGLDISRYPEVARRLTLIPEDDGVVVDLSQAEWVDSSFLVELLLFHRRLQQTGRRMIVVARGASPAR